MYQCWMAKPSLRPSFTQLVKNIGDLLEESVKTVSLMSIYFYLSYFIFIFIFICKNLIFTIIFLNFIQKYDVVYHNNHYT